MTGSPAISPAISLVIADDQQLVRAGFRVLVETASDLRVIGEAADGREATELARRQRPDVVLMDIRMPRLDGIEATRQILAADPHPRIIILTTFDLDDYVYAALRAGASGFLLKDTPPDQLLTAIRVVAAGDALLAPSITRRLIADFTRRPAAPSRRLDGITDRERQVLTLVATGLSNTEIAAELHLTVATVKSHIGRLLTKLDARDRVQLVIAAYQAGLTEPPGR